MKTKGQVEEDAAKIGLQNLIIYKPGLIVDRENDFRLGEKLASYIPGIAKINAS